MDKPIGALELSWRRTMEVNGIPKDHPNLQGMRMMYMAGAINFNSICEAISKHKWCCQGHQILALQEVITELETIRDTNGDMISSSADMATMPTPSNKVH